MYAALPASHSTLSSIHADHNLDLNAGCQAIRSIEVSSLSRLSFWRAVVNSMVLFLLENLIQLNLFTTRAVSGPILEGPSFKVEYQLLLIWLLVAV